MAVGAELSTSPGARHPLPRRGLGMVVAAVAIALSGLSVFRKGLSRCLGQPVINALMSVAVAGAFAIGQWPEAAMVMALHSLAELSRPGRSSARETRSLVCCNRRRHKSKVRQVDGSWATVEARPWP